VRRQFEPHRASEVVAGLVGGEPEVLGPDLDELTARPKAGQRQRRIGAGQEHEMDRRRQVIEHERDAVVDLGPIDHVIVVEHQHDLFRACDKVVEQGSKGEVGLRLDRCERTRTNVRRLGSQRFDDIGPEGRGRVVLVVE
jgi:hypothetical protein